MVWPIMSGKAERRGHVMRSQIGKSIKQREPTTNAVRAGHSECWAPLNFLDGGCDDRCSVFWARMLQINALFHAQESPMIGIFAARTSAATACHCPPTVRERGAKRGKAEQYTRHALSAVPCS